MISQDLQEIYTNYNESRMFYEAIQLFHPNFDLQSDDCVPNDGSYPSDTSYPCNFNSSSASFFFIRANDTKSLKLEDGTTVDFYQYPFNVVLPEVGSDQQDIGIVLDNIVPQLSKEIQSAVLNPEIPIEMTYRIYIDGSDESQITPIKMSLTNIVADARTITAKASRVDLYKRKFPYGIDAYYNSRFQGLFL